MAEPSQLGGPKRIHNTPRDSPSQVHRRVVAAVKLEEKGATWPEDAQNLADIAKNEIFIREMLQHKIAEDEVGGVASKKRQIRSACAQPQNVLLLGVNLAGAPQHFHGEVQR